MKIISMLAQNHGEDNKYDEDNSERSQSASNSQHLKKTFSMPFFNLYIDSHSMVLFKTRAIPKSP